MNQIAKLDNPAFSWSSTKLRYLFCKIRWEFFPCWSKGKDWHVEYHPNPPHQPRIYGSPCIHGDIDRDNKIIYITPLDDSRDAHVHSMVHMVTHVVTHSKAHKSSFEKRIVRAANIMSANGSSALVQQRIIEEAQIYKKPCCLDAPTAYDDLQALTWLQKIENGQNPTLDEAVEALALRHGYPHSEELHRRFTLLNRHRLAAIVNWDRISNQSEDMVRKAKSMSDK